MYIHARKLLRNASVVLKSTAAQFKKKLPRKETLK